MSVFADVLAACLPAQNPFVGVGVGPAWARAVDDGDLVVRCEELVESGPYRVSVAPGA